MSDPYYPSQDPSARPPGGQPPYAAPNYGGTSYPEQPSSSPMYGGSTYGQPSYGGPQYPPSAPPKPKTGMWIAIAVAVVIVIGGGATAAIVLTKDKGSSTANGGTGNSTRDPNKPVVEHLTIPQTIGTLTLSQSETDRSPATLTEEMKKKLTNPTDAKVGYYVDGGNSRRADVIAATGTVEDVDSKLSALFAQLDMGRVTNLHDVNPGRLSGKAKCESEQRPSQTLFACAWVDPGSIGFVTDSSRTAAEAEETFRSVRDAVLTRE
jgi:hypothetical protein